jgi:lipoate---protein ligase
MNLDADLLESVKAGEIWAYRSWEAQEVVVVLGRGNTTEKEVYEERCKADNIPIVRRRGGGGTVVLSPGVLVLSLVTHVKQRYHFQEYFWQLNEYIIEALTRAGLAELEQRGISDICLRQRKILGSSMYRSKDILFYTASLMVSNDLQLLDRYLRHPSKEPDYRQGRSHRDFVTTIRQEYPEIQLQTLKELLDETLLERSPDIE